MNSRDTITGTDGNDTFYAEVGQNSEGALANAFSTGDVIDGGAGSKDTLKASIMNDKETQSGADYDINAVTKNLEIAEFTVLDEGVVVDAGRMDSVEEFWSVNSDDTGLVLEDVRLGSKLGITKDITFGMKDVDYGSDLTVGFDSRSLTNEGEVKSNSQILVRVADVSAQNLTTPVDNVEINVGFTLDGADYSLKNIQAIDPDGVAVAGTYEALKAAIEAAVEAEGLSDLTVDFDSSYTDVTAAGNTVNLSFTAREITLTDSEGREFTNVTFDYQNITEIDDEFLFVGNASAVDPTTSSTLIESNLILDNAGRGSTAGEVIIGAMSNSDAGVEKFNVMVGDDSAIGSLNTTNNKLQEIEITSLTGETGSLEIGSTQAGLNLIDADNFNGTALMLGATTEGGNIAGEIVDESANSAQADVINLAQLNARISGDVTFNAGITQADATDSDTTYVYNTGSGSDTIDVNIDGDAVDSDAEGLIINAGNGDNEITVELEDETSISYETMAGLDNLKITTGTGEDTIINSGVATFHITAGDGSDTVIIESRNDAAVAGGTDVAGDATITTGATISTATGAATWNDRVLYEAKVVVTFAGHEVVADIDTDASGNFIADQLTINQAIKDAIASSPELSRLLTTTDTTGSEQMIITSLVEGDNDLTVEIYQPTLIENDGTNTLTGDGSDVFFNATHITAVQTGLMETTVHNDSDLLDTAAEIVAEVNDATLADAAGNTVSGDGWLDNTGAVSATEFVTATAMGTDETEVENFSTINMGAGANDLVVLNSDINSSNVLEFTDTWGKVTVVNFFQDGGTMTQVNDGTGAGVDGIAGTADDATGHILDFTAYLTDVTSLSTSALSEVRIATTVAEENAAGITFTANQVTVVNDFVEDDVNGETWEDMTAQDVQDALNGVGAGDYGSLSDGNNIAAIANLDGTSITSILMIANDEAVASNDDDLFNDASAAGEYKVYLVTESDITDNTDQYSVSFLGQVDFGAELTVAGGLDDNNVA